MASRPHDFLPLRITAEKPQNSLLIREQDKKKIKKLETHTKTIFQPLEHSISPSEEVLGT